LDAFYRYPLLDSSFRTQPRNRATRTRKKALKAVIEEDEKMIDQLQNRDSLERFAREQYGHKKENETVFIIETQDSIDVP
jgi:cell division protein FtsB